MFRILLSIFLVAFASNAMAQNYAATAGAGLTFGANLVGGVLYPQQNMCDPTTPARCVVIDASGRPTVNINGTVTVTGTVSATQSGTWTVQPGNTANTTPWLVEVDNTLAAVTPGDGITTTVYGTAPASPVIGVPLLWNGATYDRATGSAAAGQRVSPNPYPVGAVPYTASATGTTAATAATLAGASSVTTYICGFSIRANATAAATGNAVVSGTISGSMNFTQWTAPLASGLGVTEMIFSPCVPASATNTSVVVTSAAPGSGGVVSVTAWGYKL